MNFQFEGKFKKKALYSLIKYFSSKFTIQLLYAYFLLHFQDKDNSSDSDLENNSSSDSKSSSSSSSDR